jgi:hypothetical protein
MITLKDAVELVLSKHPDQYIHGVNEYDDWYQFILLNKGETIGPMTFIFHTPAVNKRTGVLNNEATIMDDFTEGDYKQYSKEDIESL